MIRFYKIVAKKYNLSIITSIHQPNHELLMMYDSLCVLAKGGVTVFSGRPQDLRTHLNDCDISLSETQLPIEVLLKIGANDYTDPTVIALSEKTNQDLKVYEERLPQELKHFPNGIPIRSKTLSFEELWHLLHRMITFTIRYNWFQLLIQYSLFLMTASFLLLYLDFDLEKGSGCEPKVSNICVLSLDDFRYLGYTIAYVFCGVLVPSLLIVSNSCLSFYALLKIFDKEFRNRKHFLNSFR